MYIIFNVNLIMNYLNKCVFIYYFIIYHEMLIIYSFPEQFTTFGKIIKKEKIILFLLLNLPVHIQDVHKFVFPIILFLCNFRYK